MAAGTGLRVALLGPLEVTLDGVPVGPAGTRRRSLLALLALHPNAVVLRDRLVDGLWGDTAPPSAANVVQTYVSAWRKALDPARRARAPDDRLARVGAGYRLRLSTDECDALAFQELAELARRRAAAGDAAGAETAQEQALALWRGPVLADLAAEPFHPAAVRPLQDRRTQVLQDWAAALLPTAEGSRLAAVVAALQDAREQEPWSEHLTALLMWALLRQGRQHEALLLYDATRRTLAEELGADPGPALQAMHRRVLEHDAQLVGAQLVGAQPVGAQPVAGRSGEGLVGRDRELDRVRALLRTSRLVTLTGPCGVGKSRLAREVLARLRESGAAVRALELDGTGGATALRGLPDPSTRTDVLLLDTLDALPAAAAEVTRLLSADPALRVLATSCAPLGLDVEQRFPVEPLALPAPAERDPRRLLAADAVRLLAERVRAVDPAFALDARSAPVLARIARRLDGLPLGLELAAPWVPPLGAEGLLARLDRPLDVPARRPGPPRHRSLRAAVAWSHDRLPPEEQRLLARLSVLQGAAGTATVEAVGADDGAQPVLPLLLSLVDAGLVLPAGGGRFRLPEAVRAFAAERLDAQERAAVQARHARWYAGWAAGLAGDPDPAGAAEQSAADLRAALDRCAGAGDPAAALRLVADAMPLWSLCGHEGEGARRLARALAAAPADAPAQAVALAYDAWLRGGHDRPHAAASARAAAERAAADGDPLVQALALQVLGAHLDDPDEGEAATQRARALARQERSTRPRWVLTAPAAVTCAAAAATATRWAYRSVDRARTWQERAVELAERSGEPRAVAAESARLALVHLAAGDPDGAAEPLRRAGALVGPQPTSRWDDVVVEAQGRLAAREDRPQEAEAHARRLLRATRAEGRLGPANVAACDLVDLLCAQGRLQEADAVLAVAEDLADAAGADAQHCARLQVRRARLLRRGGRRGQAAAALAAARRGLSAAELPPQRVLWFVEAALLAREEGDAGRATRLLDGLEQACERTGVVVPPWERAALGPAPALR